MACEVCASPAAAWCCRPTLRYCSRACQGRDWLAGHALVCTRRVPLDGKRGRGDDDDDGDDAKRTRVTLSPLRPDQIEDAYLDPRRRQPANMDTFLQSLWRLGDAHLYRAPSMIAGAGLGLFTRDPIRRGVPITWYSGPVVSWATYKALRERDPHVKDYAWVTLHSYLMTLGDYRRLPSGQVERVPYEALDATFAGDGAAQFANSVSPQHPDGQNAAYITIWEPRWDAPPDADPIDFRQAVVRANPRGEGRATVLFALRDIATGEELLGDYGRGYFDVWFPRA